MKTVKFQNKTFHEIPKGKGKYFICKETTEILSLMRPNFPKILKQAINSNGYYMVGFFTKPNRININVHRTMMETFVTNYENHNTINHKDGNKLNNQLDNLEYCTTTFNIQHAFETGLHTKFTNKPVYQFSLKGELLNSFSSLRIAAKAVKCDPANICACLKGKSKHAMGYLWAYENFIEVTTPVKVSKGFVVKENNKDDKVFSTEKEILSYLGISKTSLYSYCKSGKLVKGIFSISKLYI